MLELNKFNRAFKMEVQAESGNEILYIESPLTLEFNVVRNNLAKAQSAEFTIYNLNESTRKKIFRDKIDFSESHPFRRINFSAGYKNDNGTMMPMIFSGDIRSAYSFRERTEIKTVIECFGMPDQITKKIAVPLKAGVTKRQLVDLLISQFPNIKSKTVGSLVEQASQRGMVLFGTVSEILKELTNNKFYTDGDHAYVLRDDEVVVGDIAYLNSNSGLLGTPRRSGSLVEMDMIFEPRIKPEQQIVVQSDTEPVFNGMYKITGITHRGIISDAVGGDCTTTVSLLAGTAFKQVF